LDGNQGELKNETFALVGYGVDIGEKKQQIILQARHSTTSYLKNVQGEVVVFQINDQDSKAGGGSCFGDSCGPVFLDGYVLGDASYVNSFFVQCDGQLSARRYGLLEGVSGPVPGLGQAAPPRSFDLAQVRKERVRGWIYRSTIQAGGG
jgi:hypothetical protein